MYIVAVYSYISGVGSISWLVQRGRGRATMCELYAKIIAESELLQPALNVIHEFCFQLWSRGCGTCGTGSSAPVYHQLFRYLEDCGLLNPCSELHLLTLHYIFLPRIQGSLDHFRWAYIHPRSVLFVIRLLDSSGLIRGIEENTRWADELYEVIIHTSTVSQCFIWQEYLVLEPDHPCTLYLTLFVTKLQNQ